MPLGENIKKKRNELKMSQEDLAGALGVSRQAVSKWETGQSEPSAKNLRELSGIFHISLTELMDSQQGKAEQPPQEINQKESHFKLLCCRWLGYIFLIQVIPVTRDIIIVICQSSTGWQSLPLALYW